MNHIISSPRQAGTEKAHQKIQNKKGHRGASIENKHTKSVPDKLLLKTSSKKLPRQPVEKTSKRN